MYLFYVLFVGLGLGLGTAGLDYKTGNVCYRKITRDIAVYRYHRVVEICQRGASLFGRRGIVRHRYR